MNHILRFLLPVIVIASTATVTLAQAPPPRPERGGGNMERAERPGARERDRDREHDRERERPDGLRPPPPRLDPMRLSEALRVYIDVVDRFTRLAADPHAAGVAAVLQAKEILEPKGPQAAIDYFNRILPKVKSPVVQRAIRLQLIELQKKIGNTDQALDQLGSLMTEAPAGERPATPPPR